MAAALESTRRTCPLCYGRRMKGLRADGSFACFLHLVYRSGEWEEETERNCREVARTNSEYSFCRPRISIIVLAATLLLLSSTASLLTAAEEGGEGPAAPAGEAAPAQDFVEITPKLEESVDRALLWLSSAIRIKSRRRLLGQRRRFGTVPDGDDGTGRAGVSRGRPHADARQMWSRTVSKRPNAAWASVETDSLIDSGQDGQQMYGHGFAMTFLGEAYGMCSTSSDTELRALRQR